MPTVISRRRSASSHGMALVVVLALVVLVTVVVLAFFAQATANQQVEAKRQQRSMAQALGRSACDYVTDQFSREIVDASLSTEYSSNGVSVFYPRTNADVVPQRIIASTIGSADSNFFNLNRQSIPTADTNVSADGTASPSRNGTLVSADRWNRPKLLPGAGFTNTAQLPNWIYVDKTNGPVKSPSAEVVGRFAYNVYDCGGVLDVNVAGYPQNAANAMSPVKGTIAGADLTQVGLPQTAIDKLVAFRNPNATTSDAYVECVDALTERGYLANIVTNATTGNVYTNNFFGTRQDFLKYVRTQNPDLASFTHLLGVFSRSENSPSWSPATPSGVTSSVSYEADADKPASINRRIANVRWPVDKTIAWYRVDGTKEEKILKQGEPLVSQRFPLGRLKWITPSGPNSSIPNAAAAIKQHFGLTWDSASKLWIYTSPAGTTPATTLKTLDQVATEGREPDFFELLQAGILSGSTGRDAGPLGTLTSDGPAGDTQAWDKTTAYQIMQIGANVIDQYDADSYPTEILTALGPVADATFYGIESLPYLPRVFFCVYRYDSNPKRAGGWFCFEVWNPHQAVPTGTQAPTQFRIRATGSAQVKVLVLGGANTPPNLPPGGAPPVFGPMTDLKGNAGVQFSINPQEPTLLTPSNASSPASENQITSPEITHTVYKNNGADVWYVNTAKSNSMVGIWTGDALNVDPAYYDQGMITPNGVTFTLQYKHPDGSWRDYSVMKKLGITDRGGSIVDIYNPVNKDCFYFAQKSDPRTDRFSVSMNYQTYGGLILPNTSLRPNTGQGTILARFSPATTSAFTFHGSGSATGGLNNNNALGMLSENRETASLPTTATWVSYKDQDNINRRAEGAFTVSTSSDGMPLYANNLASRPVILNRPFRSVGEMGYVFSDVPWRNVDFFTPESGSSGLLDLFTVSEEEVVAGKISLNTRQAASLKALAAGGTVVESSGASLTASEAGDIATAIQGASGTTPFLNRSDLVGRLRSSLDTDGRFASLPTIALSSAARNRIKSQRESIVRTISDATDTRTWNLLVDVIAQSGRISPGASAAGSNFVITAEQRYWLHVAIDRITGRIIDQKLEPVYE